MVMYMRGKLILISLLMIVTLSLTGCRRVVDSPADELRMYAWYGESENGNTASLSFDENKASFEAKGDDISLSLSGLCILTDDRMIICDTDSKMNYSFGYDLYGDRVELSYNNSVLPLDKITE